MVRGGNYTAHGQEASTWPVTGFTAGRTQALIKWDPPVHSTHINLPQTMKVDDSQRVGEVHPLPVLPSRFSCLP